VTILRLPPRIKVLEAASAVAGKRIKKVGSRRYTVVSSDGTRKYTVYVDIERGLAYSSDNGTRLRGYVGYPIIAALIIEGILPYNKDVGEALKDVPWRELNEKYKRYSIVESIVKNLAESKGVPRHVVDAYMREVIDKLKTIKLKRLDSIPLI
jgi:hypothetical protein